MPAKTIFSLQVLFRLVFSVEVIDIVKMYFLSFLFCNTFKKNLLLLLLLLFFIFYLYFFLPFLSFLFSFFQLWMSLSSSFFLVSMVTFTDFTFIINVFTACKSCFRDNINFLFLQFFTLIFWLCSYNIFVHKMEMKL